VPELPEVETARRLIADEALHRPIAAVDDTDTFVCRPHPPGQLREALTGRTLTAVHRRGKTMWCETSGVGGSDEPGPDLGPQVGHRPGWRAHRGRHRGQAPRRDVSALRGRDAAGQGRRPDHLVVLTRTGGLTHG
jgi:hypothetical protein